MEIAMVGLGKMGKNMTLRLLGGGHRVVATDRSPGPIAEVEKAGAVGAATLAELVGKLQAPRAVWVMVPSGEVTDAVITNLTELLDKGDLIIDGGNSYYKDSVRRAGELAAQGIGFVDAGTSGGIWGLEVGYCLMVGGSTADIRRIEPALETLAPPEGYRHLGTHGAGHFVKMVHNGIEYSMMQAYAEGFEILQASDFELDLREVSHLWNQGSVIRSWLLELSERLFSDDPKLEGFEDDVQDSGEGRWTLMEAIERAVPAPALADALFARFRSRQDSSFSNRVLAGLRHQFGGHAVKKA